jgi:hypothetical protein
MAALAARRFEAFGVKSIGKGYFDHWGDGRPRRKSRVHPIGYVLRETPTMSLPTTSDRWHVRGLLAHQLVAQAPLRDPPGLGPAPQPRSLLPLRYEESLIPGFGGLPSARQKGLSGCVHGDHHKDHAARGSRRQSLSLESRVLEFDHSPAPDGRASELPVEPRPLSVARCCSARSARCGASYT